MEGALRGEERRRTADERATMEVGWLLNGKGEIGDPRTREEMVDEELEASDSRKVGGGALGDRWW